MYVKGLVNMVVTFTFFSSGFLGEKGIMHAVLLGSLSGICMASLHKVEKKRLSGKAKGYANPRPVIC